MDKKYYIDGKEITTWKTGGINSAGGLCNRFNIDGIEVTHRQGGTNYQSGWRETTTQNTEKNLRSEFRNRIELK